jgi:hypothetical protein
MLSSLGMQNSTDKQASGSYAQDLPTDTAPDEHPCSKERSYVANMEDKLLPQPFVGPQTCAIHPVPTLEMGTGSPLIVTCRRPAPFAR